eukprot:CAMPEP_0172154654 /NCGR_PEP_ID=MMETSP1050-20130122/2161_1 /TAXON_ID=233186 /ORGANISM="Cryptomonas curvata, Strain CCAP979/52" /LENGTH=179 /DNA_ID=CAMNT_0012823407 /DNA_START=533 /DNA_END=1068 /DNA_ORIENTATION=-
MTQQQRTPNFSEEDNFSQAHDDPVGYRPNPTRSLPLTSEASAFSKVFCKSNSELESQGPHLSALVDRPTNLQRAHNITFPAGFGGSFADRNAENSRVSLADMERAMQHGNAVQHAEDDMAQLHRIRFHNLINIQSQRQSIHGEGGSAMLPPSRDQQAVAAASLHFRGDGGADRRIYSAL